MGDFWKPTADMYSSLFEKPKMAEKLLTKPPFKYIYDILAETTKVTGFAKGLYTGEELTQEYYESKERKMAYLQKMIDLVEMMSKETVAAKPNKIVAGHEPQNTNILLQMVFKIATSGAQSDPFVKKLLSGGKVEEKPKEAPKQAPKEAPKKEPEAPKKVEEKSDSKDKKKPEPKQQPKPQPKPEPKQEPVRQPEKKPAMGLKEQEPAPKVEVAENKRPVQRPPSAKNQPKVEQKQQQPPPILDEDEVEPSRAAPPKKNIKADEYSKRVQEAMQQEAEAKQAEAPAQEQQPTKKFEMGNLRKGKRDSTQQIKGAVSSGGELSAAELDMLKNMIQTICQSSAPLGKSIQFVNDDIESMNQELLSWRKQYNDSKSKMQNELKLTEDALVPLYDKLAEIQQQIKDQKGKIQNMKTQIIKNQSTIKSLLYSVVTTRP